MPEAIDAICADVAVPDQSFDPKSPHGIYPLDRAACRYSVRSRSLPPPSSTRLEASNPRGPSRSLVARHRLIQVMKSREIVTDKALDQIERREAHYDRAAEHLIA